MTDQSTNPNHLRLTAEIVSAYVSNNSLPQSELPTLLRAVHDALNCTVARKLAEPAPTVTPPVPIRKSVTADYIVCLEDGKKFKSLKRHLRTQYNMTPEQYREKWGLPVDYPMVAPNYAKARSELAKEMGLGQQRRKGKAAGEGGAGGPRAAPRATAQPTKGTSTASRRVQKAR